jgi:hypothetical protein
MHPHFSLRNNNKAVVLLGVSGVILVFIFILSLTRAPIKGSIHLRSRSISYLASTSHTILFDLPLHTLHIDGASTVTYNNFTYSCDNTWLTVSSPKGLYSKLHRLQVPHGSYVTLSTSDTTSAIYLDINNRRHATYILGTDHDPTLLEGCRQDTVRSVTIATNVSGYSSALLMSPLDTINLNMRTQVGVFELNTVLPQTINPLSIATHSPIISGTVRIPSIHKRENISIGSSLMLDFSSAILSNINIGYNKIDAQLHGTFSSIKITQYGQETVLNPPYILWLWHNKTVYISAVITTGIISFFLSVYQFLHE